MRWYRTLLFSALLTLASMSLYAADEPSVLVIVFKDGHQQTVSMADVSRIEFRTSNGAASSGFAGHGRFLGRWRVGDGAGGHFFITLDPNGVASKTMGAAHGTWTVTDGEARISWDDGWHDVIRRAGDKYLKAAFAPGTSFNDSPSNVADAVNTSPQPN